MQSQYNTRSPAVKRLMREAQELAEATYDYYAQPLSDNLFEWHFTVRGPADTEFDGGIYHGRIVLPPDYPMKPPNFIFLTPNGRFETGKKNLSLHIRTSSRILATQLVNPDSFVSDHWIHAHA